MARSTDVLVHRIEVENREALKNIDQYVGKVQGAPAKVNPATQSMQGGFSDLGSSISAVRLGVIGLVAGGAVTALSKFAEKAKEIRNVSTAFDTLTGRVDENAAALLGGMRRASRGFVSDAELMAQANNAIKLGLPVTTASMEQLTEGAVKLGRTLGIDAASAIDTMIDGIGRQSSLLRDQFGIIVDNDVAYAAYAATLGTTASKLTDADKRMARYEETMRQVREETQGLATDTDTLGDALTRLKTSAGNAFDWVLQALNTAPGRLLPPAAGQSAVEQLMRENARNSPDNVARRAMEESTAAALANLNSLKAAALDFSDPKVRDEHFKTWVEPFRAAREEAERMRKILEGVGSTAPVSGPGPVASLGEVDVGPLMLGIPTPEMIGDYERYVALVAQDRAEREGLLPLYNDSAMGLLSIESALAGVLAQQQALVESGVQWTETLQEQSEAIIQNAAAAQWTATKFQVLEGALQTAAGAFIDMAIAGNLSAKALVHAISRQVAGTLAAIAIEEAVLGFRDLAAAATALSLGQAVTAALFKASAAAHFATAAKAGGGATAALGVAVATADRGGTGSDGSFGSSGGGGQLNSPANTQSERRSVEVRVFVENGAFVQDITAFSRDIAEEIRRELERAGAG